MKFALRTSVAAVVLAASVMGQAQAAVNLSGDLQTFQGYEVYFGSEENPFAHRIASGDTGSAMGGASFSFNLDSFTLVEGQDYTLSVKLLGGGYVAGFRGDFTLSAGRLFGFADGGSSLLSSADSGYWQTPGGLGKVVEDFSGAPAVDAQAQWLVDAAGVGKFGVSPRDDFVFSTKIAALTSAPVPSVPEPGTYAMLLAGLGLVGFAASRKKRA